MEFTNVYKNVQDHYGFVARGRNPTYSGAIAQAFGYTEGELNSIPQDANLGLSCGNPLAIASLRHGETVIDLGSGAGLDVFLAAKKVGPEGSAIGVDMNKDMLARARNNQVKLAEASNISFVEANITSIPLEDSIADCIISNCVINLVPETEKPAVFVEMARLLKPGGRVAISDIIARKPLPAGLRESVALYVGCVAGCSTKEDYTQFLEENGFRDIVIVDTESNLNVYTDMTKVKEGYNEDPSSCCEPWAAGKASVEAKPASCCSGEKKSSGHCSKATDDAAPCYDNSDRGTTSAVVEPGCYAAASWKKQDSIAREFNLAGVDLNEWAGSFKIFAVKM